MNPISHPIRNPILKGIRDSKRRGNGNDNGNDRDRANVSYQPLDGAEVLLRAADSDFAKDAETDRKAHRIALIATEQIDQLSLIGYPGLEPAYRDVVETTIFYAARGCLDDA